MKRSTYQRPNAFTTALVAGLLWGGCFGLLENLPWLLGGHNSSYPRLLLQTVLFTTILYGLLYAFILGFVGLIAWGLVSLTRRNPSRAGLLAGDLGLAAGGTAAAFWLVGYRDALAETWDTMLPVSRVALVAAAGIGGGLVAGLVGWGLYSAARRFQSSRAARLLRWPLLRNVVLAVFAAGLLSLGALGLYRAYRWELAPFGPRSGGEAATAEQPNILLITVDALRADHLGAYGYEQGVSPNLDALAERGVLFQQATAQSCWTLPSVSSFSTSLFPTELQIHCARGDPPCYSHVDERRTTLAEAMQTAGLHTQAFLTNVWLQPQHGLLQGFDQAIFTRNLEASSPLFLPRRPVLRVLHRYVPGFPQLFEKTWSLVFDPVLTPEDGQRVTEHARRFLQQHREERFFLWLYYMEPHDPYDPTAPFRALGEEIDSEREAFLRTIGFWNLGDKGPQMFTAADVQALVSLYDGEIADVDRRVGEVINELENLGLADRTLVVVVADHGEEFDDHGGYTHGHTFYQELTRVPLLFSGPPIVDPGRVVETPVSLLDLLPTLCQVAGAPVPEEARGRSLLPALRGEEIEERPAFSESLHRSPLPLKAVVYESFKLIYDPETGRAELYDLFNDPAEGNDLAAAEPTRVDQLVALVQEWMRQAERRAQELPREHAAQAMDESTELLLKQAGY